MEEKKRKEEIVFRLTDGRIESRHHNKSDGSVLVDALPYIDEEYNDPRMKDMVDGLVREEMRRFDPPDYLKDRLPELTLRFANNPVLKKEFERIRSKKSMKKMNLAERYKLRAPENPDDPNAWRESVRRAKTLLEHNSNRLLNLRLLNKFGPDAWKAYNAALTIECENMEAAAKRESEEVERINRKRKAAQENVRYEIGRLKSEWWQCLDQNYKTDAACTMYERAMKRLRESKMRSGDQNESNN